MLKDIGSQTEYSITRMVPPKKLRFYFSVKEMSQYKFDIDNEVINDQDLDLYEKYQENSVSPPEKLNVLTVSLQSMNSLNVEQLKDLGCLPRPKKYFINQGRDGSNLLLEEDKFVFERSYFRSYKRDTDQLIEKCFEFDWKCSKIPKIIKNEAQLPKVKEILRTSYRHMKE